MRVVAGSPSVEVSAKGDFGHFRSSEQYADGITTKLLLGMTSY